MRFAQICANSNRLAAARAIEARWGRGFESLRPLQHSRKSEFAPLGRRPQPSAKPVLAFPPAAPYLSTGRDWARTSGRVGMGMAYLPAAQRALDVITPVAIYRQIGRRPSQVYVNDAMGDATPDKKAQHRLSDRVYWKTQAKPGEQIQDRRGGVLLVTATGECYPIALAAPTSPSRPTRPRRSVSSSPAAWSRRPRGGPSIRRRGRPTGSSPTIIRWSSTSCRRAPSSRRKTSAKAAAAAIGQGAAGPRRAEKGPPGASCGNPLTFAPERRI